MLRTNHNEKINLQPTHHVKNQVDFSINEYLKCRNNPLYFILNYCYIEEVGDKRRYTEELLHPKLRRVVRSTIKHHSCIFMASRQLGKSSISACLIAWVMVFYPGTKVIILNFMKEAGYGNLSKIRFILSHLPKWMKIPLVSKSERKTYIELQNGSRAKIFYPSSTTKPETLARSLTCPILYIDEAAFIPHMAKIYGSAQQTLSTARQQAIKNNYPYFTLITSTPRSYLGV